MRDPSGEPARQIELDPGVTPKSDCPAVVLERGPDHRVVEWYSEILDESGTSLTLTNRYTEVATGLLNSNDPIPGFTFSDPNSASNYIYQVRACRLQQTGCGSFWNTSQGVFGKAP